MMFKPVVDYLRSTDTVNPASAHPSRLSLWQDQAEAEIDEIMLDGEGAARASAAAAKEIGLSILEKFLAIATAAGWSDQPPALRIAAAEEVLARPQVPQRTAEWYAQGKSVLTASEFATLYRTPRAVGQMIMSKVPPFATVSSNRLACMTCEMGPFDWGVRFEPVVKQILAKRWGVVIAEAGRIMHPTDTRLAASPDGIIMEATDPRRIGRLLEIKCPISRQIGEGIPFDYWCQMQVQMEVTGIEECEYVEVKIDSAMDLSGEPDGYIWLLQNSDTCEMRYVYTVQERAEAGDWHELEMIPWRLGGFYSELCVRDRAWFASTEEMRAEFWASVEKAREGSFEVPLGKSKKLVTVVKECQIVD